MNQDTEPEAGDALQVALATIERQKERIEGLQRRLDENRQFDILRDTYSLIASIKIIADPISHQRLLDMVVQTAATVISVRAASLFIIDEKKQELVFKVATGPKAAEATQYRVPLGHGIAGLVALTGQPMAIADVENSPLHASDISKNIGYVPHSILCAPLFYQEQIIGVLELLDKDNGELFNERDMNLVGIFANQAAIAIELSNTHHNLSKLFSNLFQSIDEEALYSRPQMVKYVRTFYESLEENTSLIQTLDLATLLQEIIWAGKDEQELCRNILQSFKVYLQTRSSTY